MKSTLILITLATWSTAQLIYPDEFETMRGATTAPGRLQLGFADPTQINSAFGNFGSNGVGGSNSAPLGAARPSSGIQQQAPAANPRVESNDIISRGVLQFALSMDDAVSKERTRFLAQSRENIVFSPLSVASALALVLLGSATRTFEEVSTILGFNAGLDISRDSESVHRRFGRLIDGIGSRPGLPVESSFASGVFVQDGYPIRPEYKAASTDVYKSEVINLDFANGGDRAQQALNAWVRNSTRGKIPSIINGSPSPSTSVIIASALYFKGEWNQHFLNGATRSKTFTVAPGETVNVDMMFNGGEFPFFEDKQLRTKIVGLPYKGNEVTMYVVLPTDPGIEALRNLEQRLGGGNLENLIGNMRTKTCIIGLPRMKLSSTLSLRDALQSLGLNSLFNSRTADLSLISPGYRGSMTQTPTGDGLSFPPRVQDTEKPVIRQGSFSYDDNVRGYHIEQWATGFKLSRIPRQRLRRSLNTRKLRVRRSAVSHDEEEHISKDEPTQRRRRQTNFVNNINNRNQGFYGIDDLRNNGALPNPGLFAEDVLHRVEIDITEKGTEAAAATAVILTKDGNQKRLVADRPFLFFIRHESTGLILFWGSVIKPTPNYPSTTRK